MTTETSNMPSSSNGTATAPSLSNFSFKTIGKSTRGSDMPSLLKRLTTAQHEPAHIEGEDAGYQTSSPVDDDDVDNSGDSTPVNDKVLNTINAQLRARHSRMEDLISSYTSHAATLKELSQSTASAISSSKNARELSTQGIASLEQGLASFKSAVISADQALELSNATQEKLKFVLEQQDKQESHVDEIRKELCLLAQLIHAYGAHEERWTKERQDREVKRAQERERKRREEEEERQLREKMANYEAALTQIRAELASKQAKQATRDRDQVAGPSNAQRDQPINPPAQAGAATESTPQLKAMETRSSAATPAHTEQYRREIEESRSREVRHLKEQEELIKKGQQEVQAAVQHKKLDIQHRLDQERRQAEQMLAGRQSQSISPSSASVSMQPPPAPSTQPTDVPHNATTKSPAASSPAKSKKHKNKPDPVIVKKESSSPPHPLPSSATSSSTYRGDGAAASHSTYSGSSSPVVEKFNEHIGRSGGHLLPLKPEIKQETDVKLADNGLTPTVQIIPETRPVALPSQQTQRQPNPSKTLANQAEQLRPIATRPSVVEAPPAPAPVDTPRAPPVVEKPQAPPSHSSHTSSSAEMRASVPSSPVLRTRQVAPPTTQSHANRDNSYAYSSQRPATRPPQQERINGSQYDDTTAYDPARTRRFSQSSATRQLRPISPMGPEDVTSNFESPLQPARVIDHWSPPPPSPILDTYRPPSPNLLPPRPNRKRPRNDVEPLPEYPSRRHEPRNTRSFIDRVDTSPNYGANSQYNQYTDELRYPSSRSPLTPPPLSNFRDESINVGAGATSRPSFLDRLNVPAPGTERERERDIYRPRPPPPPSPRNRRNGRGRGGKGPLASRISASSLQDRLAVRS